MSDATSSFYLDIARKQAVELAKSFIANPGYRPVDYPSLRAYLDALCIPRIAVPSASEFEALLKGDDKTFGHAERPCIHGAAGSDMGSLVKQVLRRLNLERDDWAAARLLSAIFGDEELAARVARGPINK